MQVSFPKDVTERINAKADEMRLRPEDVVEFIVETVLGPDISEEIDQDVELQASLERARNDIREGRVFSHDEIVEWHRNHPE